MYIWSAADGKSRRVTPEFFNAQSPAWAPDGELLYFLSAREYQPLISTVEFDFATDRQTGIFALALRKGAKNPFGVRDDEPGDDKEAKKDSDKDDAGKRPPKTQGKPKAQVKIEFDGIMRARDSRAVGGRQLERSARHRRKFALPAQRALLLRT